MTKRIVSKYLRCCHIRYFLLSLVICCKVWHVCESVGRQHSFLCPNGTIFSQQLLTCDWWHNVDCHISEAYYNTAYPYPASSVRSGLGKHHQHEWNDHHQRYSSYRSHEVYEPKYNPRSRSNFVSARNRIDLRNVGLVDSYYKSRHNIDPSGQVSKITHKNSISTEPHFVTTFRPTTANSNFIRFIPEVTTYTPKYNIRLDGAPVSYPGLSSSAQYVDTNQLNANIITKNHIQAKLHHSTSAASLALFRSTTVSPSLYRSTTLPPTLYRSTTLPPTLYRSTTLSPKMYDPTTPVQSTLFRSSTLAPPIVSTVSTTVTQVTPNIQHLFHHTTPLTTFKDKILHTADTPPPIRNYKNIFTLSKTLSVPKAFEFEPYHDINYPMFQILGTREIRPIYKRQAQRIEEEDRDSGEDDH